MIHRRLPRYLVALGILTVSCHTAAGQANPPAQTPVAFPTAGLLPKAEIGALRFLEEHPQFDGRGVVVAIFDTGVDPGAAGLQRTTDGKPKIVDMIDGTGSGDVVLGETREADAEGKLTGLTGRTLHLPASWLAPKRPFRIGWKAGYELFPPGLVTRLKQERREKFEIEQAKTEAELRRAIADWEAAHPEPDEQQKAERTELTKRLEQLKAMLAHYDDPGPIYDCIAFQDGDVWRAAVDTNEDGNFADEQALANYRLEHQHATFRGGAELNFGVNVYNDGQLLSLVADCGPHGTHVAGIVAAHFPDQPELNGIAPGAQIFAVKIGDPRLQEMETESGMTRGIVAAINAKCDLINMSYSEPSRIPNGGLVPELLTQAVDEHGILYVSSAGNAGPALSTVGAPGGSIRAAIGVGAYVTPGLMEAAYALRETLPEMPYTWTSRGPTFDGARGVTIAAPGGAIAPVPHWTQQRTMRMNGTSMASPNACGGLALVLSALKQQNISYTPHSVRKALENTAKSLPDVDAFAQGAGVLQVPETFEYLREHGADPAQRLGFEIKVGEGARGVYLREPYELAHAHDVQVRVRARFPEQADSAARLGFELRCQLQSTAPWVRAGGFLLLTHGEEALQILVDPTQLEPGAHYAEVQAFDVKAPARGPLFRIPVTVMVPTPTTDGVLTEELTLEPGRVERRFIAVPDDATWADLTIERLDDGPAARYMAQAVEKHAGLTFRDRQMHTSVMLPAGGVHTQAVRVTGGKTLEVCFAQFWSSLGQSRVRCTVRFQGLELREEPIVLVQGSGPQRVALKNDALRDNLAPRGKLETWRRTVAPASAELEVSTDPRDRLPDDRTMHQLVLTYKFEPFSGNRVTLRFPQTDDWLYGSPFGGHLWFLFDAANRQIATDDIWPSQVTLRSGTHTVRLRLRHPSASALEPFRMMPLQIDSPLGSPLGLPVSSSRWVESQRLSGSFAPRQQQAVYLFPPASLPSGIKPGDQLLGRVSFTEALDHSGRSADRPEGYAVHWLATLQPAESSSEDDSTGKSDSPNDAAGEAAARQARADAIRKLHELDTEDKREEQLAAIIAAADAVLATFDTNALAQTLGTRANEDDAAAKRARAAAEEQREQLADTLYRKGRALGYMELPEVVAKTPIADQAAHDRAFEETFQQLARWVDVTERKYVLLSVRRERRRGHWGAALELLNKYLGEGAPDERYYEKRKDVVTELGWRHWAGYDQAWLRRQFPERQAEF